MATTAPSTTTGSTWQIDPSHTRAEFAVKHLMISTVKGSFPGVSGTVTLTNDDDPTTAKVDVTIDVASIDTREAQRDAHLRSADFFDAEHFPTMTFRSTRITRGGDGYKAHGDLTIRGITRPVTLDATIGPRITDPWGNHRTAVEATGKIKRTDWGLNYNKALETGGVLVGDEVKISIESELVEQKAQA